MKYFPAFIFLIYPSPTLILNSQFLICRCSGSSNLRQIVTSSSNISEGFWEDDNSTRSHYIPRHDEWNGGGVRNNWNWFQCVRMELVLREGGGEGKRWWWKGSFCPDGTTLYFRHSSLKLSFKYAQRIYIHISRFRYKKIIRHCPVMRMAIAVRNKHFDCL